VKPTDLSDAGVARVGRIVEVQDGLPVTADGETLDVANVISGARDTDRLLVDRSAGVRRRAGADP
jgi:hypothetical protein